MRLNLDQTIPAVDGRRHQISSWRSNLIINASEAITGARLDCRFRPEPCLWRGGPARGTGRGRPVTRQYAFIPGQGQRLRHGRSDTGKVSTPSSRQVHRPRSGLAAALGIARSHKGAIAVTSAPGEGSTFSGPAAHQFRPETGWAPGTGIRDRPCSVGVTKGHAARAAFLWTA